MHRSQKVFREHEDEDVDGYLLTPLLLTSEGGASPFNFRSFKRWKTNLYAILQEVDAV